MKKQIGKIDRLIRIITGAASIEFLSERPISHKSLDF